MKLVAYSRTSTQNGAGSDSLDAQEDACRAWAADNGHEVVHVCRDEAVSGSLEIEKRPGLLCALMAVEDGTADGIVVHRLDRLARELHVQEAALARAWNAGDHVEVYEAVEGKIKRDDPDDPHRTFLRQVLGASAQLERGLIRARLQGGRRRKAAKGGYVGGTRLHRRYGYELVDGEYMPVEHELEAISRILGYRASPGPMSWQFIADRLNQLEIPPPSGKQWYPMTCRRIAQREQAAQR